VRCIGISLFFFSFLGCCECGKKIIPTEITYGKDKKSVTKIYLANAIFIKRPLEDYIKGHKVHGGNEAL
jgi:predicted metal-binding protein